MPRPRTTLLALLLGAITTIATAWALACTHIPVRGIGSAQTLLPVRGPTTFVDINTPQNGLKVTIFTGAGRVALSTSISGPNSPMYSGTAAYFFEEAKTPPDDLVPASLRPIALPWLVDPTSTPWPRGDDSDWRSIEASGFPFLALASTSSRTPNYTRVQSWSLPLPGKRMRTFGEHSWGPSSPCVLPLRPLFPGFLFNTLIYAALWFPLLLIPGKLRRALRRRRNHCPHCNYDLSATPPTDPCPECGQPAQAS